jgi:hypothetical protein
MSRARSSLLEEAESGDVGVVITASFSIRSFAGNVTKEQRNSNPEVEEARKKWECESF